MVWLGETMFEDLIEKKPKKLKTRWTVNLKEEEKRINEILRWHEKEGEKKCQ